MKRLPEVLEGDSGTIGPQVRLKVILCVLHFLIHQKEKLIMIWVE